MISKSTKAKRRQNSAYFEAVSKITVALVDARFGRRFYIVSHPISASRSIHMEAYGQNAMLKKYRELLTQLPRPIQTKQALA